MSLLLLFLIWPLLLDPSATHNQFGGYIEACGQLPPLVGDDC